MKLSDGHTRLILFVALLVPFAVSEAVLCEVQLGRASRGHMQAVQAGSEGRVRAAARRSQCRSQTQLLDTQS